MLDENAQIPLKTCYNYTKRKLENLSDDGMNLNKRYCENNINYDEDNDIALSVLSSDNDIEDDDSNQDPDDSNGSEDGGSDSETSESSDSIEITDNAQKLYIQHRVTKSCLTAILVMLHKMLPNSNNLPHSVFELFNYATDLTPSVTIIKHYYCQNCSSYLGIDELKLAEKLQSPSISNENNVITDITDGSEYRRINSRDDRGVYDLTLILNTDGISLSKSSKTNCWPLMITIAELPENLRSNFITPIGIWCDGKFKPTMNTFLKPFCDKLKNYYKEGIKWTNPRTGDEIVSKVVAPLIIADAPLSMKKCKTIEEKKNKSTYPFIEEGARLRQGRRMKKQALKAVASDGKCHVKGVKGHTVSS
ncbi:hypothetical protein KQX54_014655 [Cotesia glomerata]|uniref:Uncharacterized protein n=1 Tax=Cotesia glomerata TaxID=32391 RepID=A0AAV7IEW2_COTGL|nr:hypothetical protein KQX54_014655 [Cotesia glomerata]